MDKMRWGISGMVPMTSIGGNTDNWINTRTWKPYSQRYYEMLEKRKALPVWRIKAEFLKVFKSNQVILLAGETGSGKTSQIPQFIMEALEVEFRYRKMMIGCTQPCKLAAISMSQHVAREMDVTVGEEVGYSVPFEDCCSAKTVLKYLTDGMLLREAMVDPLLEEYKVIILDEAHERALATDVLFALLKEVIKKRPDLKLVVMGATLEAEKFQGYFKGAPLMRVPDWLHRVQILYNAQEPERGYLEEAITMAVQIHFFEGPGDVLVFLTDQEEIEDACRKIRKTISEIGCGYVGPARVVPLYPALPLDMRHEVFEPAPALPPLVEGVPAGRKIVVSTDIAATYLTIGGISYVVDSGFAKLKVYNPLTRVESQVAHRISKESAHQRSNCAGKTQPGKCFRLYTERCFNQDLQLQSYPEIVSSNLADTWLTLQKLGIDDMVIFNFMDPPPIVALAQALNLLYYLLVLDNDLKLTMFGEILSEFPLDPQMGVMLLASPLFNCSNEILSISAMLSVPNCFVPPWEPQEIPDEAKARFGHIDGDHLMLLNVYNAYKQNNEDPSWCYGNFVNYDALKAVDNVRQQLVSVMTRFNLKLCSTDINSPDYYDNIRKAMVAGYFMQVAHLDKDGHYRTVNGNQVVQLHPSTCLKRQPEWVIYRKHILTSTNYIHTVTDISGEWLLDIAPHYYDLVNLENNEAKQVLKDLCENREREKDDSHNREAEKEGSENELYGNLATKEDVDTVDKQMQDTNQLEKHEMRAKEKEESCSILEEKLRRAEDINILRGKVSEQHQQHNEEMECQEQFYKEKLEAVEDLVNRVRCLVFESPLSS